MPINIPLPPPELVCIPAQIIRVPAGADWLVTVTSTRAATCFTHFIDGRTQYCRAPDHDCPGCEAGRSKRWEAYVSADVKSRGGSCVLEIPQMCWWEIEKAVGPAVAGGLRGLRFRFRRPGEDARGKLHADFIGPTPEGERVAKGLNVPMILARAWRIPLGLLGVDDRP